MWVWERILQKGPFNPAPPPPKGVATHRLRTIALEKTTDVEFPSWWLVAWNWNRNERLRPCLNISFHTHEALHNKSWNFFKLPSLRFRSRESKWKKEKLLFFFSKCELKLQPGLEHSTILLVTYCVVYWRKTCLSFSGTWYTSVHDKVMLQDITDFRTSLTSVILGWLVLFL